MFNMKPKQTTYINMRTFWKVDCSQTIRTYL